MMTKRKFFASLVLGLGFVALMVCAAQTPGAQAQSGDNLPAQQLGGFINIRVNDKTDNREPAVAYNSRRDEYLVVWFDDIPIANTQAIYAQRINNRGQLVGSQPITVDYYVNQLQWQPDVAYNSRRNEYLVVWTYRGGVGNFDIWGTRLNWQGNKIGSDIWIIAEPDKQLNPAVAYNSQDDEYLVVYENYWAGGHHDIAAQRVAGDGALRSWRNIATKAGEPRTRPDVAYDPAQNSYLIAYTQQYSPGGNGNIFGKITSSNMGYLSSEIKIIDNINLQDDVALAASHNEYLAVWQDGPNTNWRTIYARRIQGDGSLPPGAPPFLIAERVNRVMSTPDVSYGGDFGYLVTWGYDSATTTRDDVYGRYVRRGVDHPRGPMFGIDPEIGVQVDPAVACDPRGDCLVVESDDFSSNGDFEIRGRFVRRHRVYLPLTAH